jgi:lauroyl/myristoyl acyltransferase
MGSDSNGVPILARVLLSLADAWRNGLALVFGVLGPRFAYGFTLPIARLMYSLLPPVRAQSEHQIGAALRASGRPGDPAKIAREAFVQRMLDLADLLLAERWLRRGRLDAIGGRIAAGDLAAIREAQREQRPIVFVTAYYGPFDLLPLFLGYNDVPAAILYKPHANASFDRLRRRVRAMAGCEMVPVETALARLPAVLDAGGAIGVVADHHDERRGIETTFLGLPTRVPRTVGVLAARHRADLVVAVVRRSGVFRFELRVGAVIKPAEWEALADPVPWITSRYLRSLENLVWNDPAQYHWLRARWGRALLEGLREPIVRNENETAAPRRRERPGIAKTE